MTNNDSWNTALRNAMGERSVEAGAATAPPTNARTVMHLQERQRITRIIALPHAAELQPLALMLAGADIDEKEAAGILRAAAGEGEFRHLASPREAIRVPHRSRQVGSHTSGALGTSSSHLAV